MPGNTGVAPPFGPLFTPPFSMTVFIAPSIVSPGFTSGILKDGPHSGNVFCLNFKIAVLLSL